MTIPGQLPSPMGFCVQTIVVAPVERLHNQGRPPIDLAQREGKSHKHEKYRRKQMVNVLHLILVAMPEPSMVGKFCILRIIFVRFSVLQF